MPTVHLHGVTHAYTSALSVLVEVDLDVAVAPRAPGWVGVVGENGSGKSTLLRLLAGELSAGQRQRWLIAAALAEAPEVLLRDEPTNHLDGHARELLLGVLGAFHGLGFVVSHDRTVLARLTTRTLRITQQRLELHAGAYGAASERWRAAEAAKRVAHDRARRGDIRQRRILAEVRRDRHSAEAGSVASGAWPVRHNPMPGTRDASAPRRRRRRPSGSASGSSTPGSPVPRRWPSCRRSSRIRSPRSHGSPRCRRS